MGEASFGKYRLIAELGHGGMADVFLAVMAGPAGSGFSKLTVIKRLRQNLAEEPEFVEMLVDEARISARLNHPNVVQTNEVGAVGNVYFLAMEYLDGQPFHRIQHRAAQAAQKAQKALAGSAAGATASKPSDSVPPSSMLVPTDPFPRECQYLVILDTLAGLHHAHELTDYDGTSLQIVHRDVTPHNVFVTYEGQVKVVDFGIAKAVGRASETRQGVVKGKVRYMAPEQAIGQAVDRRADIFSVGIMLWEAATGRRLWKDMDDLAIVQALISGNVMRSPRAWDPNVPEELDRICQRALAHDREERYATAEELRLDLEQYLAESGKLVSARRKLGAAVCALFDDKRTEIRSIIEKQLQALKGRAAPELRPVHIAVDSSASGSISMPMPAALAAVPVDVVLEGAPPDAPTSITGAASAISGERAEKPKPLRSRAPLFVVAGGLVAVVAVAALAAGRMSTSPAAASSQQPHTSSAEQTPSPVRIKLTAVPATARVTIDGALVSSPYEASLPRDTREHHVRVEAPGYEPHSETVRFEGDVSMLVTLTKSAAPPATQATATTAAPATPRWAPAPPPVRPPVTREPAPTTAAPPVTVAPAAPVPTAPPPASAPKAPKPEIDKGDPWGKGGH